MLLASKFKEIFSPTVQDLVHFTDTAYTKTSSVNGYLDACRPWNSSICPLRLPLLMRVVRVVQGDARQRYLGHFLIELTLIDSSMSRHLPSHLMCLAVIISNCFFSCPCAQQSPSLELVPKMLRQWVFGPDGDPTPRGVGFRLSQVLSCHFILLPSPSVRTRVASGEVGSMSVDWCSWENIRRGIHGSTVGAPRRALRGGSCFPRIPGSHCF